MLTQKSRTNVRNKVDGTSLGRADVVLENRSQVIAMTMKLKANKNTFHAKSCEVCTRF
jgi:hypothetical protein